jgi:bifunctional non-homologous end joining protein LigD
VEFTHLDKMMFPKAGLTKGNVLKYYLNIADTLLPHLKDRPVTLERLPDGIGDGKPRFWQKNTPVYYPKWIPRIELETNQGKPVQYALVNDADTLAYLVNQGTITFHTYLSRVRDLDHPDFVVFDLDPGENKFANIVRLAHGLREILDDLHIKSFPKTSGKSGLHVVVPWKQAGGYDDARAWAMARAEQLVAEFPKLATVERRKEARRGRIYVDVIQNAEGHHVVPPYVLRAVPEATVSAPLDWKEVTPKLNPAKFTTAEVLRRVKLRGDPMADLAG